MADQEKSITKWKMYRSMTALYLTSLLIYSYVFSKSTESGVLNVPLNDTFTLHTTQEKRTLQDNQDFIARHKRVPRDRTGINIVGLDNYCKPGNDGLYGEASGSAAAVSYFYEMEVAKSDVPDSMTIAVTAVERRINDDLATLFFPSCRNRGRKLRGFQNVESGFEAQMHHNRFLLVEGLTPIPADVTKTAIICQNGIAPVDSECSLITGGLTLYFDGDTEDSERENTLMQVQIFIEEKITRNTYSTTFEGIRRITYIPPSDNNPFEPDIEVSAPEVEVEIEVIEETDDTPPPRSDFIDNVNLDALRSDHNLSTWMSALIAIAGVVIPLGLVNVWRKRRGEQPNNRHRSNTTSYSMVDSIISFRHQADEDDPEMPSGGMSRHEQTNFEYSVSSPKVQGSQDDDEKANVPTPSPEPSSKESSDSMEEHISISKNEIIPNDEKKHPRSPKKSRRRRTKEEKKHRRSSKKVYLADDLDEENSAIYDDIVDLEKSRRSERKHRKGKREKMSRKSSPKSAFDEETLTRNNSIQKVSKNSELYEADIDDILNLGLVSTTPNDKADILKTTKPKKEVNTQNQNHPVPQYDLNKLLNLTWHDEMVVSFGSDSSETNSEYSFEEQHDVPVLKKRQSLLDDFSVSSPDLSSTMDSTQVSPPIPAPFQSQFVLKRRMSAIEELSSSTLEKSSKLQDGSKKKGEVVEYVRSNVYAI